MSSLRQTTSAMPHVSDAVAHAYLVLSTVPDPEIPVLSLLDLGVIRSVELLADGALRVGVAPTYSGSA